MNNAPTQHYRLTEAEHRRLQNTLLAMYRDIDEVCARHHLSLMLVGGSALGAVRHKGFIPWDDDMDLALSRADYNRFLQIFPAALGKKYHLTCPNSGSPITNSFMKLFLRGTTLIQPEQIAADGPNGIWIDIFPIEYAPDNALARQIKGFLADALAYLMVSRFLYVHRTTSAWRHPRLLLGSLIVLPVHTLYNAYDRFVRGKPSGMMTIPTGRRHYRGETLPAAAFFPPATAEFAGRPACVPADADQYLTNLYGDYHQLPPPEKRERHDIVRIDFERESGKDTP